MIITRAVEESADAIGLSALLVSTSRQMPLIVNELSLRKLNFPVLIGGAAINRRFGRRILQVEDGSLYPGGVFYCKDAFEGLSTMDQLSDKTRRQGFQEENRIESQMETGKEPSSILPMISVVKSNTSPAKFIPRPPAVGTKSCALDAARGSIQSPFHKRIIPSLLGCKKRPR